VYSFAAVLYEVVSGQPPFGRGVASVAGHIGRPVPSVRLADASLADEVDAVLGKGLAKSPQRRYPSAGELVVDFLAIVTRADAKAAFSVVTPLDPTDRDAHERLEYTDKKHRVSRLQDEARDLYEAGDWEATIRTVGELQTIDAGAATDLDAVVSDASRRLAEVHREAEKAAAYDAGLIHLDRGELQQARAAFQTVHSLGPRYRDTDTLLEAVESQLSQAPPSPPKIPSGLRRPLWAGLCAVGVVATVGLAVYASSHISNSPPSATRFATSSSSSAPPSRSPGSPSASGKVVFDDDFSSDKGWVQSGEGFAVVLKPGVLHTSVTAPGTAYYEPYPGSSAYSRVRIEAVMASTGGDGSFGLACKSIGASGYDFWIDSDGTAHIAVNNGYGDTDLQQANVSGWDPLQRHTLTVVCSAGRNTANLAFLLDGQTIVTASDSNANNFLPAFVVRSAQSTTIDVDMVRFSVTRLP
jgi:hypothetical protein